MRINITGKEVPVFILKFLQALMFSFPKINCRLPIRWLKEQAVIQQGVIFNFGSKEGLQCFKEFNFLFFVCEMVAHKLLLYQVPVAVNDSKAVFCSLKHEGVAGGRLLQLHLHMAVDDGAVLFHIALVKN